MEEPMIRGIRQWLEEFRKKYPKVKIERIKSKDLTLEDKAYLLFKTILETD